MAVERIKSLASHLTGQRQPAHPNDPLSTEEIGRAVDIVRKNVTDVSPLFFNTVALLDPRKHDMLAWLSSPSTMPRPPRKADLVCIGPKSTVYDGVVNLETGELEAWSETQNVQPLITMEDLRVVEGVCRRDEGVIRQCEILGIPREDMHKVYCDPWTIGYDERFGTSVRLQQALMYYRPHVDDSQYSFPLDFCPIYDADAQRIVHIDVPELRRPVSKAAPSNFHAPAVQAELGLRNDLKPIHITQPEGVSFKMDGHQMSWANWNLHIGFNHREGIVLNNITFTDRDQGNVPRSTFYRLSLVEMVVPYGNPDHPHQRKHAFDLGEYGGGYMTNSLSLGCDCKGAIKYLDFPYVDRSGTPQTIKNAVCIHEEDAGILFKHTDFRDESCTVTRARKLVISHVFTAANYEYCVYWNLMLDGTITLEIRLTGILNTYGINDDEPTHGWGTRVAPGVNAHNHQHLFCLRIDPAIDGHNNTVFQTDAKPSAHPVGSAENKYGNAFFADKTRFNTVKEAVADYDGSFSRTWDMANLDSLNEYSGAPASYKLVSREVPPLLPKEGSLVWKRAGFARHAVHVTRYSDDQVHPAGRHVPQTSGEPNPANTDLTAWIEASADESIVQQDVVLWHTFGLTHFPAPEDFPIMPAEPMMVMLRPRHFFKRNPALDVTPSFSSWPSQISAKAKPFLNGDGKSRGV